MNIAYNKSVLAEYGGLPFWHLLNSQQ